MKTMVWDLDDVLNDLMRSWFERCWKPEHAGSSIVYEDLRANPPYTILGMEEQDYLCSLDRFRLSAEAGEMKPDPAVLQWFKDHGAEFRHIVLTARPIKTLAPAVAWLMQHYGEWFQTISFVPSARPDEHPEQADKTKADFLAWLGKADYYIDDLPAQVSNAAYLGIKAFVVAQPWNESKLGLIDILDSIANENRSGKAL